MFPSTYLFLAALLTTPQSGQVQTRAVTPPTTGAAAFEITSVKPNNSGDYTTYLDSPPGTFKNITPRALIEYAYNVPGEQCSGGPPWIDSEHFDVVGKMSDSDFQANQKLDVRQGEQQRRLMLQALLTERFGLKVQHVPKEINGYVLVIAKGGLKVAPTGSPDPPVAIPTCERGCMMVGDDPRATIGGVADTLSRIFGHTVVDETGLRGTYHIRYTVPSLAEADQEDRNAAIRQAMQEQLGLKVEARKILADTIVVDHIDQPSPN